jgi:hypothetical protein
MKAFFIAAALLVGAPAISQAQPVPNVPVAVGGGVDHLHGGLYQPVDYACGRGWRLTRYGECVPRRGPPPDRYHRPPPREWGWAPPPPPPPRYRPPPPPPQWGWAPPPRPWGPPPGPYHRPPPRGDWGPPPRW